MDWAGLLVLFLAVILAEFVSTKWINPGAATQSIAATAPVQEKIIYANPLQQYIHDNYPNAHGL